jgi:hypothetical protein
MKEFNEYFKPIIDKVEVSVNEKCDKYPMQKREVIENFLLTWTKHHYSRMKRKARRQKNNQGLKTAFWMALVTFETACNSAMGKLEVA